MRGSMQGRGAKGRIGREGGVSVAFLLSAPFLILLFQSRGHVCSAGRCAWRCWTWVADGRQGTGATGKLWFFELILVHVCISVCACACECVVFHWPIFWVVGFTCVAMRAGLGPPSRSDVDLVCLIQALPPPPSYRHRCAYTHPCRQTPRVHWDSPAHTSLMHACTHKTRTWSCFYTHMNTLSFFHIERSEQPDLKHMCSHALMKQSNTITTRRHRLLSVWVECKMSVMIIWCDASCFFVFPPVQKYIYVCVF